MSKVEELRKQIAELEEAIKIVRQEEEEERKVLRNEHPPVWKFTLLPSEEKGSMSDTMWDDSCIFYTLRGEVVNFEEAKFFGHPDHSIRGGAMKYAFNTLSGKIVCAVGGGTIYVSEGWGSTSKEETISAKETMDKLSAFLVSNPEGGDVTEIVSAFREKYEGV